jgi:hypothetical protein
MKDPYEQQLESPGFDQVDTAEPFVQAEVENMKGWVKWKVKVRVKGNDVLELLRLIRQAEDRFREQYGTQVKEIDGKL